MPGITNYTGMPYTQYGASSNSNILMTMSAGSITLGDAYTFTIEGISATYTAVAADVAAGGAPSTVARLVAALNAQVNSFSANYGLYQVSNPAPSLSFLIIATTSQDNNARVSSTFAGTGSTRVTPAGPTLVGGSGGVYANNINGNISYYVHPDETAS